LWFCVCGPFGMPMLSTFGALALLED